MQTMNKNTAPLRRLRDVENKQALRRYNAAEFALDKMDCSCRCNQVAA